VWLQGGGEVLFLAAGSRGMPVRVVDVETREVRGVGSVGQGWRALRPSHDGTRLAFYTTPRGEAANVWVAPIDDPEGATQITFDDSFVGFPVWSPDNRFLAVELAAPYGYQLAVVPSGGGELRQLTDEPGEHWPGSWSPDGRRILYAASRGGTWELRWIDRDGGDQIVVLPGDRLDVYYRYPAWSPTGERIVYERGEVEADLWEVELP
jgi:TolB protein